MKQVQTTGRYRSIVFAGLALLTFSLFSFANDDKQVPAERAFTRLVGELPAVLEKSEFPTVWVQGKKSGYFTEIQVARMVAPDKAKITVTFAHSTAPEKGQREYGRFTLFLSWYQNAWTVTHHEESKWFTDETQKEHLLKFITAVDMLSDKKP